MGTLKDLTGNHYGYLEVIKQDTSSKFKNTKWICKCQCGKIKSIQGISLKNGKTKSCGCQSHKNLKGINKTHGMTRTHIYQEWLSMRKRCRPNSNDAKTYYNRGIRVCQEWDNNFLSFYEWAINNGYDDSLSLDRIDNDAGYFPSNCRWIDIRKQQGNKSNTVKVLYNGQEYCLRTLCTELGFSYKTVYSRYTRLKTTNKPISTDVLFASIKKTSRNNK